MRTSSHAARADERDTVSLTITRDGDALGFRLAVGGGPPETFTGPHRAIEEPVLAGLRWATFTPASELTEEVAYAARGMFPLPGALRQRLRAFGSRAGRRTLLLVELESDGDELASWPWELLPRDVGMARTVVARLGAGPDPQANAAVAAGRPATIVIVPPAAEHDDDDNDNDGPRREADTLCAELLERGYGARLVARDAGGAVDLGGPPPGVVHLTAGGDASPLRAALSDQTSVRLAVLNTGETDADARALAGAIGCAAIGWYGHVRDEWAYGFARQLYAHLDAGRSVLEAVAAFVEQQQRLGSGVLLLAPCVWVPSRAWLLEPVFAPGDDEASGGLEALPSDGDGEPEFVVPLPFSSAAGEHGEGEPDGDGTPPSLGFGVPAPDAFADPEAEPPAEPAGPPRLELELEMVESICPALVRSGHVRVVRRLALRVSAPPLTNVRIRLTCDVGDIRSTWTETLDLESEDTELPVDRLNFPVLYELIERDSDRRWINVTVAALQEDGRVLAEKTRRVLFLGRREWLNTRDTRPYVASYVITECAGVKRVITEAQGILRILRQDGEGFTAYMGGADDIDLQMRSLYQALQGGLRLSYITPPGGGVYVPGSGSYDGDSGAPPGRQRSGQRVRFPDEVIEYRRGTCHDLALLLAACAEHVGIFPIVVLVQGHTLLGYWRDHVAHRDFWADQGRRPPSRGRGEPWSIRGKRTLIDLLKPREQGGPRVRLIEATDMTKPDVTFDAACEHGAQAFARRLLSVVDVRAARAWVEPVFRARHRAE